MSETELPFDLEPCLATVRAVAERKLASPLETVALTAAEAASLDSLDDTVTAIDDCNARQVQINEQIASLRSTVAGGNLTAAGAEVVTWENRIARKNDDADKATKALLDAIADRQKLEGEKAAARVALDTHTATMVGLYKDAINKHLKGCGTSFQITELKTV